MLDQMKPTWFGPRGSRLSPTPSGGTIALLQIDHPAAGRRRFSRQSKDIFQELGGSGLVRLPLKKYEVETRSFLATWDFTCCPLQRPNLLPNRTSSFLSCDWKMSGLHTELANQNLLLFVFRFSENLKEIQVRQVFTSDNPPLLVAW